MVEIDCPACGGRIEIGQPQLTTYNCPLCEENFVLGSDQPAFSSGSQRGPVIDFLLRPDPSGIRLSGGFERSIDRSMQHTYPLFVGRSPRVGSGQARALAAHAMSPFKLRRYRKEFSEGIFNPAYLQGTGLAVDEHGQVLLIGGPEEDVFFDLEHLDRLEVIEDVYSRGIMRNHATECRVHIHVYGFHAMTLHRFKHDTARQIVSALLSIRDVPLTYRQVYHEWDTGGGDGGSGGG